MSTQESADQDLASATDATITPTQQSLQEDSIMKTPDSPPEHNNNTHSISETQTSMTTPPKTDTKINHGMPGSSWSSKKFREEYDRAMDNLVDKNWDGDMKYGDPLLPK